MTIVSMSFINVLKPAKITSHDVVARLRKLTGIKQIGHAGTLDPEATGVLPLALGKACRLIRFLKTDKIYRAEVLLGIRTSTDDLAGDVLEEQSVDFEKVEKLLSKAITDLVGEQEQIPPVYSAIHYQGKRLYELAREGKIPDEIKARKVNIERIEIISQNLPVIELRIQCSGGTYIRSIARDLGEKLGTGACLKSLVREKSGPFLYQEAISLEALNSLAKDGKLSEVLIKPEKLLEINYIEVDESQAKALIMGQAINKSSNTVFSENELCLAMGNGSLIALCRLKGDNRWYPEVVVGNVQPDV